jgi:hypothetical protein
MISEFFLANFCTLAKKQLEKIGDFRSFSVNLKKMEKISKFSRPKN